MAKILCNYFGLSMAAEGKSDFVGRQAAAFLGYVQQDAERCAANCGSAEDLSAAPEEIKREILSNDEELRRREQTAPGVEHDVVAIYDNAGIPSIMHRFRRVTNKELFGGSDAVHPAFIIGGEVYDEIYISVYENTMINGKPYSLPLQEPVTNITMEDFAQACFSKGEGWHCLTAAEWGLLADTSLKLGTLPHGNTNCSHWHGDDKEQGIIIEDSYKTLTGSGPATWTHDHTASGVHDLCGNIWEFARGVRIRDGALWAAENNDAALPETDLTECGDGWKPITDAEGHPLYVAVEDNKIFKSITFDNGTEFAAAEELERSCINKHLPRTKVYFCHPYSSWERGTNENTNGMIRRRFPKGTNFAAVTNAQITQAENWINNYPRKILGYKSSEIVFRECLRELGIAA